MVLQLTTHHHATLQSHAERTYPEECCGILLGVFTDTAKILREVWPTENAWQTEAANYWPQQQHLTPGDRYVIAPTAMLQAMKTGRERQLEIIGIYHSHPQSPAIPSEFDRVYGWPQYSYVIISLHHGKAADWSCWTLDENQQFQAETITILKP